VLLSSDVLHLSSVLIAQLMVLLLLFQMEHEKKEEALQKEIDRHRSEKTKLETEKKMKQDRMVRIRITLPLFLLSCVISLYELCCCSFVLLGLLQCV